jgi:uncharacterized repeat protein (TIGR03843 family)
MTDQSLELLSSGQVKVLGAFPYASNYTFLARVCAKGGEVLAVYKPTQGERPLWDFPVATLARREVAAFVVSEAAGFDIVPPTVLRDDGPLGDGSMQLFIEHDPDRHYFVLAEERLPDLAVFAAFDVVVNNADRKAGHVLEDRSGKLWAVDHGLSFHEHHKLRTVIWEFAEQTLPPTIGDGLERLAGELESTTGRKLAELLTPAEVEATRRRVRALLAERRFPPPRGRHPLPWPLV